MDNKSMSDRNGKVVEEKVPLRRADTLKKNRWRKSGTGMTSSVEPKNFEKKIRAEIRAEIPR